MTSPEFSRPFRVDSLGDEPRRLSVQAEDEEKKALARRFGLAAIDALAADAALVRNGVEVRASGRVRARVTQTCVISARPVEQEIDEPLDIVFRTHPEAAEPDEEVELSEAEMDVVFYDGAAVDMGEAVAETLSLALDPYPRAPGAEEALKAAGVKSEAEAGPFGALSALKDKLSK